MLTCCSRVGADGGWAVQETDERAAKAAAGEHPRAQLQHRRRTQEVDRAAPQRHAGRTRRGGRGGGGRSGGGGGREERPVRGPRRSAQGSAGLEDSYGELRAGTARPPVRFTPAWLRIGVGARVSGWSKSLDHGSEARGVWHSGCERPCHSQGWRRTQYRSSRLWDVLRRLAKVINLPESELQCRTSDEALRLEA
eukprot:108685-Rhodomonas_salina.1